MTVLFGLIAVVLVLVCVLIWLNVFMIRRRHDAATVSDRETKDLLTSDTQPPQLSETELKQATDERLAAESVANMAIEPSASEEPDSNVEVMHSDQHPTFGNRKMFQRSSRPYVLHNASVPAFDTPSWDECFMRLSSDGDVLGWIGFEDDTVGASDRDYDSAFLDVLRSYRQSVNKLQREVGLSHVLETSVVGDQGKIWFITGTQEIWFALFVERDADVHTITNQFKAKLLELED